MPALGAGQSCSALQGQGRTMQTGLQGAVVLMLPHWPTLHLAGLPRNVCIMVYIYLYIYTIICMILKIHLIV